MKRRPMSQAQSAARLDPSKIIFVPAPDTAVLHEWLQRIVKFTEAELDGRLPPAKAQEFRNRARDEARVKLAGVG